MSLILTSIIESLSSYLRMEYTSSATGLMIGPDLASYRLQLLVIRNVFHGFFSTLFFRLIWSQRFILLIKSTSQLSKRSLNHMILSCMRWWLVKKHWRTEETQLQLRSSRVLVQEGSVFLGSFRGRWQEY